MQPSPKVSRLSWPFTLKTSAVNLAQVCTTSSATHSKALKNTQSASGGTKITASSKYTTAGASTLYAHWTFNYGDCNGDGVCSIADVVTLQKYLTAESDTIPMPQNADMNKDNKLTTVDLALLKRKLLKL